MLWKKYFLFNRVDKSIAKAVAWLQIYLAREIKHTRELRIKETMQHAVRLSEWMIFTQEETMGKDEITAGEYIKTLEEDDDCRCIVSSSIFLLLQTKQQRKKADSFIISASRRRERKNFCLYEKSKQLVNHHIHTPHYRLDYRSSPFIRAS